jgi:hypothetical protein
MNAVLRVAIGASAAAAALAGPVASASEATPTGATGPATPTAPTPPGEGAAVPPSSPRAYLQYGVALAAEAVASAGTICDRVDHCIFGDGGGLVARAGWRPSEEIYLGGAYEISKQDPQQLYRLGILQQVRAEGRRLFPTGREVIPFVLVGAGLAAYGNEWAIDTWGPTATFGGGIEVELGGPVLELSIAYRPMYFHEWVVATTNDLQAGIAHFIAIDVSVEARDRL